MLIALLTLFNLTFHIQCKNTITHEVGIATCSAVWVGEHEALTAAHCVSDTTGHMWVKDSDNNSFKAEIIKKNKYMDLCLLRIEGPSHKYTKLGSPVKIGQSIYLMSSQYDMPFCYGEGIVSNVLIDNGTHILTIVHTAGMLEGGSGSGLYDRWGHLVGINTMIQGPITYAVDIEIIKGFMEVQAGR